MRLAKFYLFIPIISFLFQISVKTQSVKVLLISDEAGAVLSVLEKRKTNQEVTEADWRKIFNSEGYVRLKKRELSLKRPFEDEDFKKFVLSDELLKKIERLKETLAAWEKVKVTEAAHSALKYLPKGATIRAKIYPVIKPRENSFVFEVKENPAIFLFLDPTKTQNQFKNTLTHELHHIGYGTVCPNPANEAEIKQLSEEKQTVLKWSSAFGEGLAMLAAAGGVNIHPHQFSPASDRQRWDQDVRNFNQDLKKVETFFQDVLANRLTGDKINETAFSFFGIQGPWYTVGWKMSVVIEKTFGRRKLIEVFCDQRKLLLTYNQALTVYNSKNKENLVGWSDELINQIK